MTNQKISKAQEELLNIIMDIGHRLWRYFYRKYNIEECRLYKIRA